MKKIKFPTLSVFVVAAILMVTGPTFTVQNVEACTTKETWQRGTKILWDCVGTSGTSCGRCKKY